MAKIIINLQKKQTEFRKSVEKFPVTFYGGAKGGGKSYGLRNILIILLTKYPKSRGLLVRKTYDELMSNHIEQLFRENPALQGYYNAGEKMLKFPNGSILKFRHMQYAQDVYNYQGQEFDFIGIDEITQHQKEIFTVLRSSNRTTNKDISPKMILTGNPGGIGHVWVKKLFIDKEYEANEKPTDYNFVSAKVWDNAELIDNDPEYIERLKALPERFRKAYLDGDWNIFEGQYFTEWRTDIHVIRPHELDISFPRFLCLDYGYSAPTAVYWIAVNRNKQLEVYREYYERYKTYEDVAKDVKRLSGNEKIDYLVADPACFGKMTGGDKSGSEIFSVNGLYPIRGNNDRLNGWRYFRDYLKPFEVSGGRFTAKLQVWTTCPNLIKTLPEMIHDDKKPEDLDTTLEDHCCDAIRYGIMSRFVNPKKTDKELELTQKIEDLKEQQRKQRFRADKIEILEKIRERENTI